MKMLADRLGRRHAILTGHGTTALWLTLEYLAEVRGTGDVILPALLCPSVAQVVTYAGFRPVFADVHPADFTLDLESVAQLAGPQTRAIVPVHLFGHSADIPGLRELVDSGTMIIEDAAQSLGGRLGSAPHGALGHAAILSFGGTKMLHAGGGGALVTDDDALAAFVVRRLPGIPTYEVDPLLALSHRNLYHALMDLVRTRPGSRVGPAMRALADDYRPLYRHRFPTFASARLEEGLRGLDDELARRRDRAEATAAALAKFPHLSLNRAWSASGACWRYTFLADTPGRARAITTGLRHGGVHASNHYFSLARLFDDVELSKAEHASQRIVNLWVDDVATDAYVARTAQVIEGVLERNSCS
jgi:dTDP-4-amino-4,6-dideoxygalactose transaminase